MQWVGSRICVLIACYFLSLNSFSQIDSTYIGFYEQPLSVRVYLNDKFTALSHQIEKNDDEISYVPNAPFGIGLGFSYKNVSLSGAYGFDFMRNKKKGKTKSLDFQYHYYGQKFIYDIFFQQYKGLYSEPEDGKYELYPDIKLIQYGLNSQYVFSGQKFSYSAAFNQNQLQLKSAGSFLLGGAIYYNYASSDGSVVFDDGKQLKNWQFGVNGGYAYTWAVNRRFFVSLSASVGVNVGLETIDERKTKVRVYPSVFPRFSMGYNHDTWSVGFSGVNNRVYILYTNSSKMAFDTGALQFNVIKRFGRAPKFLEQQKIIDKYNEYRFW
ncbi:DUF4421 family protein [Dysgonomonas sp. Marseille-P4677]|uniref:DUF4421 domain-containing protein n=1 Tax=Dysgonomonas sp. Marseille-P4677 TaxID=2364790 RepID=UPI00191364ED|nr:DUF4421 domain-containing protein [Dysgonomonas sp. Marseille-P4677]MBK5721264.1 DUF4421 family protein [Dysgonomonas sp. Marseille-P4677]